MPHWLQLMLESLAPLLWACLTFTIPLTILSFVFGLLMSAEASPSRAGLISRLGSALLLR